MINGFDLKKVMEWLGLVLKCPICGNKYKTEHTKIVETEQNENFGEAQILIHSDCSKCKSSVMFNIEIRGPEVFSVGMVTDLTQKDSATFRNKTPISPNEVIDIHKALKGFKGNLAELLKGKQ